MAVGTKVVDSNAYWTVVGYNCSRVLVKTSTNVWGMIIQQDGADSKYLELYKSTDGENWTHVLQLSTNGDVMACANLDSNNNLIVVWGLEDNAVTAEIYWRKLTFSGGTWSGGSATALGSITGIEVKRWFPALILESDSTWWLYFHNALNWGDANNNSIIYTTNSGSSWTKSRDLKNSYRYCPGQFVRFSDGIVLAFYIDYYAENHVYAYHRHDTDAKTSWSSDKLPPDTYPGNYGDYYHDLSLAVDSNDDVWCAYFYYDTTDLKLYLGYAKWNESTTTWDASVTILDDTADYATWTPQAVDIIEMNDKMYFFYIKKSDQKIYYRLLDGSLGSNTEFCADTDMVRIMLQRSTVNNTNFPVFYTKETAPNRDAFVLMLEFPPEAKRTKSQEYGQNIGQNIGQN